MKITCNQNSCRALFLYLIPFYFQIISRKTSAFHQFFVFVFLPYILCATRFSLWSRFFADSVLSWRYDTKVLINYMTNVSLYLVVSYFEPLPPALHQFVIPAPILIPVLIWNPSCYYLNSLCPDLKSLPRFVIPLALICNPQNFSYFFVFSHFGTGIWTWITFDFVIWIWWNLVWDTFGMIPKNDLGYNKFNPSHWWQYYLVLFWYWNSDMNNSWLSRSNDLFKSKHLSCNVIIWSRSIFNPIQDEEGRGGSKKVPLPVFPL